MDMRWYLRLLWCLVPKRHMDVEDTWWDDSPVIVIWDIESSLNRTKFNLSRQLNSRQSYVTCANKRVALPPDIFERSSVLSRLINSPFYLNLRNLLSIVPEWLKFYYLISYCYFQWSLLIPYGFNCFVQKIFYFSVIDLLTKTIRTTLRHS